jgi:hypothetical protein
MDKKVKKVLMSKGVATPLSPGGEDSPLEVLMSKLDRSRTMGDVFKGPRSYTFNLAACTLHLHPTPLHPYTLHPALYNPHPQPCTLHPTPFTLHPVS